MGFVKSLKKALTSSGLDIFSSRKFDEDAEHMVARLHADAHEGGGLACNDKQLLAEMRECIMQWLKSMGRQILQGNLNLVNTSFPVRMFEPRSYLQKMADVWAYPDLINAAAQQQEPLERMKLLVAWLVAGLHRGLESWKKPFNPILGETWQAVMPGDVHLFMEQISHHPPMSAYQLTGPGWKLNGWSQPAVVPVVRFYGIKTVAKGARHIEFADGSTVLVTTPYFAIKGVVYAAKPHAEVLGVARLLDERNRLEAVINFGPVPGTRQRMLARADAVCGEIYQLPKAAHLQDAAAAVGALQRSSTAATSLTDMAVDVGGPASASVGSHDSQSDADEQEPAVDDEAIFQEFTATHFGGPTAAAPPGSAAQQHQQQQPVQHVQAVADHSSRTGKQRVACSEGGHGAATDGGYRRSKSSVYDHAGLTGSVGGAGHGGIAGVPGVAVARIEGCWLSHLNMDNKRYWTLSESTPQRWQSLRQPLPSDLQYRQDLSAVASQDLDGAQHWKEVLEHQQRADRKLREAAGVYEHHH